MRFSLVQMLLLSVADLYLSISVFSYPLIIVSSSAADYESIGLGQVVKKGTIEMFGNTYICYASL